MIGIKLLIKIILKIVLLNESEKLYFFQSCGYL